MISKTIKKARSNTPNGRIINDLSKSITSLRNMRPVGTLNAFVQLPWGQTLLPGQLQWTVAFTTSGVPKATKNDDGTLSLGKGEAYEAYPVIDENTQAVTLTPTTDNPLPVYNLAANTNGEVGANHWIIIQKFWDLWIVTWEECDESSS